MFSEAVSVAIDARRLKAHVMEHVRENESLHRQVLLKDQLRALELLEVFTSTRLAKTPSSLMTAV